MKKKEQILRAFIQGKFEEQGWELNEKIMEAVVSNVKLEEGTPPIDQEIRTTTVTEGTDGKYTAESIKLYNLVKMKNYDMTGFVIKEYAALMTEDDKLKFLFTILNLFHEFYSHAKYEFNEQDAKVLLLIHDYKEETFSLENIYIENEKKFTPALSKEKLLRSLKHFVTMRVLKENSDDKTYAKKERIIIERK